MTEDANRRARTLFLVKFGAIIAVLYLLIAWNPVNDKVIVPFTKGVARAAGAMAAVVESEPIKVRNTAIMNKRFAVDVNNGCNGIEAVILLIAAIGAFPSSWRSRVLGILAGFVLIQFVNTFRVAFLFWLGAHYIQVFDLFHVAVWQTLIILFSVGLFVLWSWKFATPRPVADSR